jgi:transposase
LSGGWSCGASEPVPAGVAGASGAHGRRGDAGLSVAVAAITAVAQKLGIGTAETLRKWVRRAEVDDGRRPGLTSQEHAEIKRLKRENAELRRANEILKAASAFFAAELDRPQTRS